MNVLFQSLISESTLNAIAPFILLIVGIIIETKYVGRVAMFTNAGALYIFYHPINMSYWLGIIVNLSIIIGLIGGISRALRVSLPSNFYKLAWISSSVITSLLLLFGIFII